MEFGIAFGLKQIVLVIELVAQLCKVLADFLLVQCFAKRRAAADWTWVICQESRT
ncbi:MAG TPA: hypothetical protein VGP76_23565 [Planctomycetaceae bacterium]|nr:hypothetical protein [Planctomycetaceae bacterium]